MLVVSAELRHGGPIIEASSSVEVHEVVTPESLRVGFRSQETCHRPVLDSVCSDGHRQILPVASAGYEAFTARTMGCEEGDAYLKLQHQRGRVFYHAVVVSHGWLWRSGDGMEFLE